MLEDPNQLSWAVCDRDPSKLLGTMQITLDKNYATVHYDISHKVYGRGYTTEALQVVLQWCLVHLPEVTQFLGDTQSSNIGSRRVMEKCGFTHYKTETVRWEKFDKPIELVSYRVERGNLESSAL
ncbi:MAG: GNAT family N-acetyltransferase [Cyanobacteria bacterium J06626_18]